MRAGANFANRNNRKRSAASSFPQPRVRSLIFFMAESFFALLAACALWVVALQFVLGVWVLTLLAFFAATAVTSAIVMLASWRRG